MAKAEKPRRVPVSGRAVMQRINRELASQGKVLKKSRGERARQDFGDYYIIDVNRNFLVESHCDLEELGRKLAVLRGFEEVQSEGGS
jgi:hypothetical protein